MVVQRNFIQRGFDSMITFFLIIINFVRSIFMANPIPPSDNRGRYRGIRDPMAANNRPINFACGPGG